MNTLTLYYGDLRTRKKLAEFYLEKQKPDKALLIAENYYQAHRNNYIIGLLYAKCLLQNQQYSAASTLLLNVRVIPFEGATEGRELYRQALLLQATEQLKNKKYKTALELANKAKAFPENLGSGKPYEADIDYRAEDYITAICYRQTNKNELAEKLFREIAAFPEQKNGYKANIIIQAWALQQSGGDATGREWLERKLADLKDTNFAAWALLVFNHKKEADAPSKDGNMRLQEQLAGFSRKE